MPTTKTITLYTYDALPTEQAKEKARAWWIDNIECQYPWETIKEDAECMGLKVECLDLHRANAGEFITSAPEVAESIMREHGKDCETYRDANTYLQALEG